MGFVAIGVIISMFKLLYCLRGTERAGEPVLGQNNGIASSCHVQNLQSDRGGGRSGEGRSRTCICWYNEA